MARAYIGLGSNLQGPAQQLSAALEALAQTAGVTAVTPSPFYCSIAIGPGEQPDYVNAVALIETTLSPLALLDALQAIEQGQGRERGAIRWTARTLDLDVLLYDDLILQTDRLTIPHPRMAERNFVLQPLFDLAPNLQLPDGRSVAALLAERGGDGLQHLAKESPV